MGATFTMFSRSKMIQALLAHDSYVPLTTLQVALTRSIPVTNSTAAQLLEPTTGGYVRQSYAADSAHWASSGFGEYYNTMVVTFPQVTAVGWGLIRGWAVLDPGSGQCIAVGSILDPFAATAGMIPRLDPGVLLRGLYD